MNVRRLRYFLVLAEELNFRRAAAHLHIAQPALSQQIRVLERELGVRLLDRDSRAVSCSGPVIRTSTHNSDLDVAPLY
jgi:DNA-binding transcriptional LysR family regulator